MTTDKRSKARIRTRMAKTGERYTTARSHTVDVTPPGARDLGYALRGGQHPDSAALANVLAHGGITGPGGAPLSEAMLLGVMGGLGAGYILWEFAHDNSRPLALGFCNQWQYYDRAVRTALQRLGVDYDIHTTGGAKSAARQLQAHVDAGRPALIWPDRYLLGYWYLPPHLEGHGGHPVVVSGERDGRFHLDDRTLAPLTVEADVLHAARARVGSYKNTLIVPRPASGPLDPARLRTAVLEGIADCIGQLGGGSTSFSAPAWRKWARLLTDERNAKGWPSVFADRVGLVTALLSVWEATSQAGMTGGHLRDLYAGFLNEAGPLVGADVDAAVATLHEAARTWTLLGDVAVDPAHHDFAQLRDLTATIREAIAAGGDSGRTEARTAAEHLWRLRDALDADCPLSRDAVRALLARMRAVLEDIYALETTAVAELSVAITGVT